MRWCETYDEWAAAAATAGRLGIRMYAGPSYRSGVNVTLSDGNRDVLWNDALGEQGLADAIRFVEDFDGAHDGLVRGVLLPARIETMRPALMKKTAEAAKRLDVKVRLHCLQGQGELRMLRKWYESPRLDTRRGGVARTGSLIITGIFWAATAQTRMAMRDLRAARGQAARRSFTAR